MKDLKKAVFAVVDVGQKQEHYHVLRRANLKLMKLQFQRHNARDDSRADMTQECECHVT
jgi:hypothetical protein